VAEPPLLLWAFVAQLRAPGADPPRPAPLPRPYRAALAAQATILLVLGAALFVAPQDVGDVWPWGLTELTGRAIAAWLIALGGLLAAIRWENERSRVRLGLALLFALVLLQALALVRFGDEVAWSQVEAAVLIAFIASLLATALAGWRTSTG
jgi:peptidoglycan/LPS O-acetylase OafA/YrhL